MTPCDPLNFFLIRVLDGGLATQLERRGFDLSGPLWSAHVLDTAPDAILAVHLDYLRTGADCISTASYQISALGYRELNRPPAAWARALHQSVDLAVQARALYAEEDSRPIRIAASLGPYGAALHNGAEYHGRYTLSAAELIQFHAERLAVLADTPADLIAFETIPSLHEAEAILRALESTPHLRAWLSLTCRDAAHTAHGEPLRLCAQALADSPQILAIGINCTPPLLIADLISEARLGAAGRKPIIVYPNSGESWDAVTGTWRGLADPIRFGALALEWFAAGAQAVGGCCRTGPAHIAQVALAAAQSRDLS